MGETSAAPREWSERRGRSSSRRAFVWLNLLGGAAVLASYAHGLATHPGRGGAVWGGVPEGLRPLYTVSMLLAAAGYFPMTLFALRRAADSLRVWGRPALGVFGWLYALVLIPSALWMPLTFRMLEAPSPWLWALVRLDLLAVGAGALGILAALVSLRPRERRGAWRLAVAGSLCFCFQTAVLDAVVWPAFFPGPG
jgi:hypothetical protein